MPNDAEATDDEPKDDFSDLPDALCVRAAERLGWWKGYADNPSKRARSTHNELRRITKAFEGEI